eukprot:2383069-Rhodomonas_salina.1
MTQRRKALLTTSAPRKDPMVESETNTAIVSASGAQNSQSHTAKQIPPPHGLCLSIDAALDSPQCRCNQDATNADCKAFRPAPAGVLRH